MDPSRSPLRQMTGCSRFSVLLILFAIGTLGEESSTITSDKSDSAVRSTSADSDSTAAPGTVPTGQVGTKLAPKDPGTPLTGSDVSHDVTKSLVTAPKDPGTPLTGSDVFHDVTKLLVTAPKDPGTPLTGSDVSHDVSKSLVTASKSEEATSKSTLSLEEPPTTKHLNAEQQERTTPKQTELPQSLNDKRRLVRSETTPTAATLAAETQTTEVVQKPHVTVGEPTSSGRPTTTVKSTGLMPRSSKGGKETNATKGQPVPEDPAKRNSSGLPETLATTVTSTTKASETDTGVKESPSKDSRGVTVGPTAKPEPDIERTTSSSKVPGGVTTMSTFTTPEPDTEATASPAKASKGVIVAIVLCVLLLLILLFVFLYYRRRHHSGSTTFKSAAWAGQATLPDDSGMDKELEQGAASAGEGETRRATLTTFFGRRQSRVPSVAMEEVAQKETVNVEETQRLMDGDASRVSSPEGSGEANGKVLESTMQRSQDTEFPPPPANQEDTPPTKQE